MSSENRVVKQPRRKLCCGVCPKAVIDGKDAALFCEGQCQSWAHQFCVSVSQEQFKHLSNCEESYLCPSCTMVNLQREVSELKAVVNDLKKQLEDVLRAKETIASLNEEIVSLCRTLQTASHSSTATSSRSAANASKTWTDNRSRQRTTQRTYTQAISLSHGAGAAADKPPRANVKGVEERRIDSSQVKVPGVRRVWGTKKDAPPAVVLQTIRQLTKADAEKRLTVKRKFKEGGSRHRDRWWFLLHGSESILEKVSSSWSSVSLQVGWK